MFSLRAEEEFINDPRLADPGIPDRRRWRILLPIAAMIAAFLLWAYHFEIEEVTRGTGRVVPSSQVKVVQSLEGGIVSAIFAAEGDVVEAGEVLMQIDDTGFTSDMGELEKQKAAILAEKVRLEAEAAMASEIEYDPEFARQNPLATGAETELFYSRREQLVSELSALESSLQQRIGEKEELDALQEKRRAMIAPLTEERDLMESLADRQAVPRIELLRLTSRLAELEGDLAVGEASRKKMAAAIEKAKSELETARSAYVMTARQRLARLQVELAVLQETLRAAEDRVARTHIRSPVNGTVNRVHVATIGAVVPPGGRLAEIVPADDGLLVEADILPADVAFIKPGDRVAVKITAYDFLVYGSLTGSVQRIGADTISDPDGREFFRIAVRTDRNYLGTPENPLPISPGMVASIDIQTGRKTVMDYLLKPLRRASADALRER